MSEPPMTGHATPEGTTDHVAKAIAQMSAAFTEAMRREHEAKVRFMDAFAVAVRKATRS